MISATGSVWSSADCTARREGRPPDRGDHRTDRRRHHLVGARIVTRGNVRPQNNSAMQAYSAIMLYSPRCVHQVPDPLQGNRYGERGPRSEPREVPDDAEAGDQQPRRAGAQPARRLRPRNPTGSSASRSNRRAAAASSTSNGNVGLNPIRTARCSAWVYKSGVRFCALPQPSSGRSRIAVMVIGGSVRPASSIGRFGRVLLDRLALQRRSEQSGPGGDRHHVREHQPEHDDPGELPPTPDPGTQETVGEQDRRGEKADKRVRPEVEAEAGQSEQRQRRRLHQRRHPRLRQPEQDEDRHRSGRCRISRGRGSSRCG